MIDTIKNIYIKYKEIVNYLIFGVLATLVNLISKYVLLFTVLDVNNAVQLQVAVIISWIVAVLFAYFTNSKIVFKSKNENKIKEFISFIVGRLFTLILEMFVTWFFITFLKLNTNMWVIAITIFAQALVIIVNYILSKLFIFKKK